MTSRLWDGIRTERDGQTLAIVAVMIVGLLAIMSFGIDLGMAYTARAEAQRVADASALAGASAFLDFVDPLDPAATDTAETRAADYAERNMVHWRMVQADSPEVIVRVIPDSQKVRVRVERTRLPSWFARFLGYDQHVVSAIAAAEAVDAGPPTCLMPFAIPDMWDEVSGDDYNPNSDPTTHDDKIFNFDNTLPYNGPPAGNPNEAWEYNPEAGDQYRVPPGENTDFWGNELPGVIEANHESLATGWGTDWRDGSGAIDADDDNGAKVLLKPQEAGPENQLNNWWQFWKPEGSSSSYNDLRQMILSGECQQLPEVIERVPGDRAVVYADITDYIDSLDPPADTWEWDEDAAALEDPDNPGRIVTQGGDIVDVDVARAGGRVISVPLVHPEVLTRASSDASPLAVTEVVDLFLEDPRVTYNGKQNVDNSVAITGRIVRYGSGTETVNPSKFQKLLRLIE